MHEHKCAHGRDQAYHLMKAQVCTKSQQHCKQALREGVRKCRGETRLKRMNRRWAR